MKYGSYECDYCGDNVIAKSSDSIIGWGVSNVYCMEDSHICPNCREKEEYKFDNLQID